SRSGARLAATVALPNLGDDVGVATTAGAATRAGHASACRARAGRTAATRTSAGHVARAAHGAASRRGAGGAVRAGGCARATSTGRITCGVVVGRATDRERRGIAATVVARTAVDGGKPGDDDAGGDEIGSY